MGKRPTTAYVDDEDGGYACRIYEVAVRDEEDAMAFTVLAAGTSPDDAMAQIREEYPHAALWVVGLYNDEPVSPVVEDMSCQVEAMLDVEAELNRAISMFPPMASAHEGWAIIKEEMDELWELVRLSQKHDVQPLMRDEAKQVAAMAVRFMMDLCGEEEWDGC